VAAGIKIMKLARVRSGAVVPHIIPFKLIKVCYEATDVDCSAVPTAYSAAFGCIETHGRIKESQMQKEMT
jgi:hypothetical protein